MIADPGLVALAVLRILAHGARSLADVQAALPQFATPRVAEAVERLQRDGLVHVKWKRLELTRAGKLAAPSTAPMLSSQGEWKPEPVVRRAGSCTKHLPSRVGDQLLYGGRM